MDMMGFPTPIDEEVAAMLGNDPVTVDIDCHAVGSRVTCNPPVMDTDRDILVLCKDVLAFGTVAVNQGWKTATSLAEGAAKLRFVSVAKGEVNLIAVDEAGFRNLFLAATSVAKRLNLMKKEDRIALFQAVLYGRACE